MKIVFPHIPKCAGTSIKFQIESRDDVYFDYFNHPTWICQSDKSVGEGEQKKLKAKLAKLEDWFVFGHFSACAYDDTPYDLKILILRDPLERAVSHFHYVQQTLPDTEVTRRRHSEVSLIKDGRMSMEEFAELDHIQHFYGRYYLRGVALDSRLIIFSIDNLQDACKKISEACQIELKHSVSLNRSNYSSNYGHLKGIFASDTDLYRGLINRQSI